MTENVTIQIGERIIKAGSVLSTFIREDDKLAAALATLNDDPAPMGRAFIQQGLGGAIVNFVKEDPFNFDVMLTVGYHKVIFTSGPDGAFEYLFLDTPSVDADTALLNDERPTLGKLMMLPRPFVHLVDQPTCDPYRTGTIDKRGWQVEIWADYADNEMQRTMDAHYPS